MGGRPQPHRCLPQASIGGYDHRTIEIDLEVALVVDNRCNLAVTIKLIQVPARRWMLDARGGLVPDVKREVRLALWHYFDMSQCITEQRPDRGMGETELKLGLSHSK